MPPFTPGTTPSPELRAAMQKLQDQFIGELLKEIIPVVERTYRVKSGPEYRAVAGLSMGGGQTTRILTTHPDEFAFVGIWSAGVGDNADAWAEQNKEFLSGADKVNRSVKLLSISVGDRDFAQAGSKAARGHAGEARDQARGARQRRRPHVDQLAPLPQ